MNDAHAKNKERLLQQVKKAPIEPGVYLMKNSERQILYIGKAKNLRNRLTSYFQPKSHESPRTEMLVTQIEEFVTY